jgi:hypothetical protein
MPAKPRWLLKIPAIVDSLTALNSPVVDRSVFEKLFGLRARRARELMHRFTGYECGNTVVIDRLALIDALQRIAESPEAIAERARKERLSAELARMERYRSASLVRIPVPADVHDRTVADLPAGVKFEAGRLTIDFDNPLQLLSKLYELSQAAANDLDGFNAAACPH